ncbi:zeta toxin family protein [Vibrio sonorensis]|uniref:zeta toxin family protein n=1 Tax=Vibrio sonorensis TaxID=1004316 RepID=UPI0008D98850|nr:zeta toxin family protein [Vibrio sonorensis]
MPSDFLTITKTVTKYSWSELRQALDEWQLAEEYDDLIGDYQRISHQLINDAPSLDSPTLEVIAGIPYAGKSHYIKAHCCDLGKVSLSFDSIMSELSLYKKLHNRCTQAAFHRSETLAQMVGYQILNDCIAKRCSVLFEHSSAPEAHIDLYLVLQKQGYQVEMTFLDCSIEQARLRAKTDNKNRDNQRYTPEIYIEQRYHALQNRLTEYRRYFDVTVRQQDDTDGN